ncbi:MAG: beta-lactamase family protein, partial [Microbacteriaceae bacterium]|nr:beta-lactamase family protein [Microbacteriaceae bacterium]
MTSLLLLTLFAQQIPQIDTVIEAGIAKGELPGAVCIVGQKDRILHKKAYGNRMVEPRKEAMTLDTIFDAASLTKVVATTSSILKLIEEGKVRLADRVTVYLPEFQGGKSEITVRHLLTHYSGLRPD